MNQEELDQLSAAISKNMMVCQKDILTVEEACIYTGLKKSCLYKLTSGKSIPHYKPNGKVCYFKRSDLDAWMLSNRVSTFDELNTAALSYTMRRKSPVI